MLISFVVPCYNVREYIAECLASLEAVCRLCDAEVIVINDGSTDTTLIELKRWQDKFKDGRYTIIDKDNGGLSSARNAGLDQAKGEYVFLLDSDDYLDVANFPVLVDELQQNKPDAVFFTYHWLAGPDWYWESGHLSLPEKQLITDKNIIFRSLFKDKQFYSWAKIFRRGFYEDEAFPDGQNYEDIATVPRLVGKISNLYYLPVPLVFYRQRANSIMKSKTVKNAIDLSKSTTKLPAFSLTEEGAFYYSELKLYVFLWSLGDLASSSENSEADKSNYLILKANFYSTFSFEDRDLLLDNYKANKDFRMVAKTWLAYKYPDLLWKIIRVKKR